MSALSRIFSDSRSPTAEIVRSIVQRSVDRWTKTVRDDMHLWNDLHLALEERVELMHAIEMRLKFEFTPREIEKHYTVGSLIALVEMKVEGS